MLLSIVIVTHNRLEQLKRTIPSIQSQLPPHELVLIDDGSSDDTHKWASQFADIKFLRIAPHFWRNPAHAKNFGVACSSGDIVIIQDAEILHESQYNLETIFYHFSQSSESILVKPAHVWYEHPDGHAEFQLDPPRVCLLFAMYRYDYINLGGFNEKWYTQWGNDDVELIERCKAYGMKIIEDPELKIRHLQHEAPPEGDYQRWQRECRWSKIYREQLKAGKANPRIKWRH